MAIYMPPITKKKRVIERYNPDTFRVISDDAVESHPKCDFEEDNRPSEWRQHWLNNDGLSLPDIKTKKTEVLPHAAPDYRLNKPHPRSCGFLRNNVRILNEPICSVYTDLTKDEQDQWWPSRISHETLQVPPRTVDTIYRLDFADREQKHGRFGATRHTANPNTEAALGTGNFLPRIRVPVNFLKCRDGSQRFYKEKKSYEHQYNSRSDPNYPIRGKRHGAFVWDPMTEEHTRKIISHYSVISAEEGTCRQESMEAESLANEATQQLESMVTEPCLTQTEPAQTQLESCETQPEAEHVPDCTGSQNGSAKSSKKNSPSHSVNNSARKARKNSNASVSSKKCEDQTPTCAENQCNTEMPE